MLRVFIVDDEPPARDRLNRLLTPLVASNRVNLVGEASDGFEALQALSVHTVDLLFLDIQMPEMDGFSVLERLTPEDRPAVVFTTAYDEYALKAFEVNAADYLLKPISSERLDEAVARIERVHQAPRSRKEMDARLVRLMDWLDAQDAPGEKPTAQRAESYLKQLSIPFRDRILIVPSSRLIAAEVSEGITRLYVAEETAAGGRERLKQHIVNYTLDQLESSLEPDRFLRVHRSAIVQLEHIQEMVPWFSGRYKLVLTGGHEVIASRERSRILKDKLMI